jgi:hypothetical protein
MEKEATGGGEGGDGFTFALDAFGTFSFAAFGLTAFGFT